ncbi:MAG: YopX family protein [Oscillospiraceae bacterium]
MFRGFHEDENGSTTIYVYGVNVKGEWIYGYYCLNAIRKTYITTVDGDMYVVIPATVGEYTGLYGEDGKRIFEGDKCIVTMFDYEGLDWQYSCEVSYDEGGFFAGNDTDVRIPLQEIGDTQADVTVTGTIFDKEVEKCD